MAEVKAVRKEELASEDLVRLFEQSLARARMGELMGVTMVTKTRAGEYEYTRVNMRYELAVGLHQRASYKLMLDWDEASR